MADNTVVLQGGSVLEFRGDGHIYTVDGRPVLSVSELIAPFRGYGEVDGYLEAALDAAAERGVICHAVIADMLTGGEPEYPGAYEGYIEAVQRFFSEHAVYPIAIEQMIYSLEMDLAGTPDLLCEFDAEDAPEGSELAILDYKFVSQVNKTGVQAQLNAYRRIYADNGVAVDRLYAVQFMADGTYRLYPVAADDEGVRLCLRIRELRSKKHERGKIG